MKSILDIKTIKKLKNNFYTSEYFIKSKKILNCKIDNSKSVLQFICFNNSDIIVSGINEVIQIIKKTIPKKILKNIEIYALSDGDIACKDIPIMKIIGDYRDFCFLENIIDGILASCSSVATNVKKILETLKPNQELIYMADRTSLYFNHELEGYSAFIGGCKLFTTKAEVSLIENKSNVKVVGTIPHALIQQYDNKLDLLIKDYFEIFNEKPIILLDYENDVIKTLNEIKHLLHLCYGIRLDTSKSLTDKSLENINNANGVSKELILLVKNWLLKNNFEYIKICISSGLNYCKIKSFQEENVPIDIFGVGSSFLNNSVHISADLVSKNGVPSSKFGRKELNIIKMKKYI